MKMGLYCTRNIFITITCVCWILPSALKIDLQFHHATNYRIHIGNVDNSHDDNIIGHIMVAFLFYNAYYGNNTKCHDACDGW